jgi:hypothetical protein
MDASSVIRYLTEEFDHVVAVEKDGDTFFTYDPSGHPPDGAWQPFVTVVTGDRHDRVSHLDRDGAYRLNVGLTKATYTACSALLRGCVTTTGCSTPVSTTPPRTG